MKFRTELPELKSNKKIALNSNCFFIGSCFSDNMYAYLNDKYMLCASNPFGTVFNPISIQKHLSYIVNKESFDNDNLFKSYDFYLHFDVHSKFYAEDKDKLLQILEDKRSEALAFIEKANFIFITLGTALVYEKLENGQVVSNCHKQPDKHFKRRFLSHLEVTKSLGEMKRIIQGLNPSCEIIFTLSPVRHLRSGMIENNASKGILRSAIHEVCDKTGSGYFPSYEIMMDDLRDYRFYETDMIHPSKLALNYLFEQFGTCYFDEMTQSTLKKIEKYNDLINHRPQNINSHDHSKTMDKIAKTKLELSVLGITLP